MSKRLDTHCRDTEAAALYSGLLIAPIALVSFVAYIWRAHTHPQEPFDPIWGLLPLAYCSVYLVTLIPERYWLRLSIIIVPAFYLVATGLNYMANFYSLFLHKYFHDVGGDNDYVLVIFVSIITLPTTALGIYKSYRFIRLALSTVLALTKRRGAA